MDRDPDRRRHARQQPGERAGGSAAAAGAASPGAGHGDAAAEVPAVPRWVGVVAVLGMAGVVCYVAAWIVAGAVTPGYDPWQQAISETFAVGAPEGARRLVAAALVASGLGLVLMAVALDRGLPGRGLAGPAAAAVSGVATVLVAAYPCTAGCPGFGSSRTDSLHVAFAGLGYVTLMLCPLLCGWRVRRHDPGFARWSAVLGGVALAAFLVRNVGGVDAFAGVQQRVFNTVADAWYFLAGVVLLRRSRAHRRAAAAGREVS